MVEWRSSGARLLRDRSIDASSMGSRIGMSNAFAERRSGSSMLPNSVVVIERSEALMNDYGMTSSHPSLQRYPLHTGVFNVH